MSEQTMTKQKMRRLMFRWSIFTAFLIALYWLIYYFKIESVPSNNVIEMIKDWTITLNISRWWDILIGPSYSIIIVSIIYFFKNQDFKNQGKEDPSKEVVINFSMIMLISFYLGLISGLIGGLVFGLCSGLTLVLILLTNLPSIFSNLSSIFSNFWKISVNWLSGK